MIKNNLLFFIVLWLAVPASSSAMIKKTLDTFNGIKNAHKNYKNKKTEELLAAAEKGSNEFAQALENLSKNEAFYVYNEIVQNIVFCIKTPQIKKIIFSNKTIALASIHRPYLFDHIVSIVSTLEELNTFIELGYRNRTELYYRLRTILDRIQWAKGQNLWDISHPDIQLIIDRLFAYHIVYNSSFAKAVYLLFSEPVIHSFIEQNPTITYYLYGKSLLDVGVECGAGKKLCYALYTIDIKKPITSNGHQWIIDHIHTSKKSLHCIE